MRAFYNLCVAAVLLCALVAGAQAITVNVSVYKHNFTSNETIPSIVTNMSLGAYYSQKATFYQYMKPGEPSEIGNNNVTWPFAHRDEVFNMTNVGTVNNSVYIGHWWPPARGGGYEELWFNGSSSNLTAANGTVVQGAWNRSYHYEYDQIGTYISRWHADPLPGARIVASTFWINGSKLYGPANFTENTSVWSRNPAYVTLDYYENNTHAAHDWFTIDMDLVVPPLTPDDGADDGYPGEPVGTSDVEGTATPTPTATVAVTTTCAACAAGQDQTGTPAVTATPTPTKTGGSPVGDQFPWLYLLLLLLLLGVGFGGFIAYKRRKNDDEQ